MPIRAARRPSAGFRVHVRAYEEHLRAKGCSADTLRQVAGALRRAMRALGRRARSDVRSVKEEQLLRYARALARGKNMQGRPLALWSQRIYVGVLRRFFRFLEMKGVLLHSPARDLVLPRARRLAAAVPSTREVSRLIAVPLTSTPRGQRNAAVLELLYGAGLRVSECSRLDVSDLDLRDETLLVRNGKGKKDRVVPVTARARMALDLYIREGRAALLDDPRNPALFCTRYGRLQPQVIQMLVRGCAREAKLTVKTNPHSLRHACATHLLQNGADIRSIQQLLGHKNLYTTSLYTRVAISDLRQVMAKCHPRGHRRFAVTPGRTRSKIRV